MRLLLDTRAVLWFAAADRRLSLIAKSAIEDPDAVSLLSAVVVWEVAIKRGLNRLQASNDYLRIFLEAGAEPLQISFDHAQRVEHLPPHHRDPFDRLLVAQAQAENAMIVTSDARIARYDVPVLW